MNQMDESSLSATPDLREETFAGLEHISRLKERWVTRDRALMPTTSVDVRFQDVSGYCDLYPFPVAAPDISSGYIYVYSPIYRYIYYGWLQSC